jgi:hypothetical protein
LSRVRSDETGIDLSDGKNRGRGYSLVILRTSELVLTRCLAPQLPEKYLIQILESERDVNEL